MTPTSTERAARWLLAQSPPPPHIVSVLRKRFGLSSGRAVAAIRRCNEIRARSAAKPEEGK